VSFNRSKGRLSFEAADEVERARRSDEKVIETAAVRLLARREHGAIELKRKLQSRGYVAAAVDAVILRLTERGMLSDLRFVVSFIKQHAQRGHGPTRIRGELRQQGVAPEAIEEQLRLAEIDWDSVAATVRSRKFKAIPRSGTERAKQSRFLQYRGFSSEQIRAAMGKLSTVGIDMDSEMDLDAD
jgi:regulatory protein